MFLEPKLYIVLGQSYLHLIEKYLPETVKKSKKHKSIQLRVWRLNTSLK